MTEEVKRKASVFRIPTVSIIWLYFIVNNFVFNLDGYLSEKFSYLSFLFNYKYIILPLVILFIWYKFKTGRLIQILLYVIFFPLIMISWLIPSILLRNNQYKILSVYGLYIVFFFFSIKARLLDALIIASGITFVMFNNKVFNFLGVILMAIYISRHFYYRIYTALKPVKIMPKDTKDVIRFIENRPKFELDFTTNDSIEKKDTDRNFILIYSSTLAYISRNIGAVGKSGTLAGVFVYNYVLSLLTSIFCFTFINYGLFKMNSGNFKTIPPVSVSDFLFYSFFSMFGNGMENISAYTSVSQIVRAFEIFTFFIILALIAIIYFSFSTPKFKEDLEAISKAAEARNSEVERNIQSILLLSIREIKIELEAKGEALARLAIWIDNNGVGKLPLDLPKADESTEDTDKADFSNKIEE